MSMDLGQLLREADASAARPVAPAGNLGAAVRAVARRRRRVRAGIGSALAALALVTCGLYALRPHGDGIVVQRELTPPVVSPEEARREIARLDAEARSRMAVVERVMATERRRSGVKERRVADPLLAVRREQDRTAYLLIYEADRLARKSEARERAVEEYRRVLALFPDTHWASVARERLVELNGSSRRGTDAPVGAPAEELL
jgi:hypothetical protein